MRRQLDDEAEKRGLCFWGIHRAVQARGEFVSWVNAKNKPGKVDRRARIKAIAEALKRRKDNGW